MLFIPFIAIAVLVLWSFWNLQKLRSLDPSQLGSGPIKLKIEAFTGFGHRNAAQISGRVSKDGGRFSALNAEFEQMGIGGKFRRNLRRFLLPEMEGVQVEIRVRDTRKTASTDVRGRFTLRLEGNSILDPGITTYSVCITSENGDFEATKTVGQIVVPPDSATVAVISDIDDTVVSTHVKSTFRMLLHTAVTSVSDLKPTPGFPSLLTAAIEGKTGNERNPVFYVSGSPANLHDKLHAFLRANRFPIGPLFLTSIGREPGAGFFNQRSFKTERIRELFRFFPKLRFVLFGDNIQVDSEIYHQIALEFPGRVLTTLIYERIPQFMTGKILPLGQHRVPNAFEAGMILYQRGWVSKEGLRGIANELIQASIFPDSFNLDRVLRKKDRRKREPLSHSTVTDFARFRG